MELSLEIVLGHVLYVMFEWSLVKGGSQASFDLPCWRWLMVESVGDTTRNVKFWFWICSNHVRGSATNQDWNGIWNIPSRSHWKSWLATYYNGKLWLRICWSQVKRSRKNKRLTMYIGQCMVLIHNINNSKGGGEPSKIPNWNQYCSTRPRISLLDGYQKMIGRLFQGLCCHFQNCVKCHACVPFPHEFSLT